MLNPVFHFPPMSLGKIPESFNLGKATGLGEGKSEFIHMGYGTSNTISEKPTQLLENMICKRILLIRTVKWSNSAISYNSIEH